MNTPTYIVFKQEGRTFLVDSLYTTRAAAIVRAEKLHKGATEIIEGTRYSAYRSLEKVKKKPYSEFHKFWLEYDKYLKTDKTSTYILKKSLKGLLKERVK